MPQERLSMRKIREVLRLKWEGDLSPGQDLRQPGDRPQLRHFSHHGERVRQPSQRGRPHMAPARSAR